jgi:hypothetical protein
MMSEFSAKFMKNSIDVHGIHLFLIRNTLARKRSRAHISGAACGTLGP